MPLVQIVERVGFARRVPRGHTPCVEIELATNQEIVKFDIREMHGSDERVTADFVWRAWVATRPMQKLNRRGR